MTYRIGIDVGGTFTDFVLLDRVSGSRVHHKEASTPSEPSLAVDSGVQVLLEKAGVVPAEVELIVHGTTISLNALLQRKGAKVALVTSTGSRDILELARIRMSHSFDFFAQPEQPLVPRERVLELAARVGADGEVVKRPSASDYAAVREQLLAMQVDAVVVSVVNGYLQPQLEEDIALALSLGLGGVPIVASTSIWAESSEYERTMIAVMNGYITPIMHAYYDRLETLFAARGLTAPLSITASNGGTIDLPTARARPIDTILSGPAAGVVAAAEAAERNGVDGIVTFDMGGTSADIAAIEQGTPDLTTSTLIGEIPLILPVVNVSAIGAGGGSIIRVDDQGFIKVGPHSAGAVPGPACYQRGGTAPTMTDCYLLCGFFDPATFLGGRLPLDPELSRQAMLPVAEALGYMDREQPEVHAAAAALQLAGSMMATEVRKLLARRGSDINAFTLLPYGGAGSVHAGLLADAAGLGQVLIPQTPATFCALGAVVADLRRDFVRSCSVLIDAEGKAPEGLGQQLAELDAQAHDWASTLGERAQRWHYRVAADMRYQGQAFDLSVELKDHQGPLAPALRALFESRHHALYGFSEPAAAVEIKRLVVSAVGELSRIAAAQAGQHEQIAAGVRRIFLAGRWFDAPYLVRDGMPYETDILGPAIIEQSDTTVVVPVGWTVRRQASGDLKMTRQRSAQ